MSKWPLEPGKRITITIPERAGIPESIALKGSVIRMGLDERGGETPYSAAVAFDPVPAEVRHELEWVLEERARGPATLRFDGGAKQRAPGSSGADALDPPETRAEDLMHRVDVDVDVRIDVVGKVPTFELPQLADDEPEPAAAAAEPAAPEPDRADDGGTGAELPPLPEIGDPERFLAAAEDEEEEKDEAGAPTADRRSGTRADYRRRVPAFGDRAMRVLVARDLSMNGMRVERESGLEIGERGGIQVDQYMLTSDPDIYAIGDCAEKYCYFTGKPTPLRLASKPFCGGRVFF